ELQGQFVSQNPGVREALEGQMHRLREMFAGQGLEQTQVSVTDRSAGEPARQGDGQLAKRAGGQRGTGRAEGGPADNDPVTTLTPRVERPLRGLVDYYVCTGRLRIVPETLASLTPTAHRSHCGAMPTRNSAMTL